MYPRLPMPARLRDVGVTLAALGPMAAQVMHERGLYFNPCQVQHATEIEALLERAW